MPYELVLSRNRNPEPKKESVSIRIYLILRLYACTFSSSTRDCRSHKHRHRRSKLPSKPLPHSYQIFQTMPAAPSQFTDELRVAAGDQWDRIIQHKFTKELAAGTIDRKVLKKYLIQDHRFLDAFVVLLGSIISHARSLEDRIPACQFLALVTSKENTYFERCFEQLGCAAGTDELDFSRLSGGHTRVRDRWATLQC